MSEGFTIANFRTVAHGPQEGQFAVGERKKALGLSDLDPKYRRLLDEPVTRTLGLIGPGGRVTLTPMWFDYEGEKVLVNTASHRPKCEWIRKNPHLTILLVNPKNPYHWVQIKCTVEKELREWEPGGEYVTKQLDRIWHKYTGQSGHYGLRDPKIDEKRVLVSIGSPRSANRDRPLRLNGVADCTSQNTIVGPFGEAHTCRALNARKRSMMRYPADVLSGSETREPHPAYRGGPACGARCAMHRGFGGLRGWRPLTGTA